MPREACFKVEGIIVEVLPNMIFRVELKNRHRLIAHLARSLRGQAQFNPGDRVTLQVTPFDLSSGRIIPTHS